MIKYRKNSTDEGPFHFFIWRYRIVEKVFTLKTKKGSWNLLFLFVGIMLFFAFLSNMLSTNFYRVTHTKVSTAPTMAMPLFMSSTYKKAS